MKTLRFEVKTAAQEVKTFLPGTPASLRQPRWCFLFKVVTRAHEMVVMWWPRFSALTQRFQERPGSPPETQKGNRKWRHFCELKCDVMLDCVLQVVPAQI